MQPNFDEVFTKEKVTIIVHRAAVASRAGVLDGTVKDDSGKLNISRG